MSFFPQTVQSHFDLIDFLNLNTSSSCLSEKLLTTMFDVPCPESYSGPDFPQTPQAVHDNKIRENCINILKGSFDLVCRGW